MKKQEKCSRKLERSVYKMFQAQTFFQIDFKLIQIVPATWNDRSKLRHFFRQISSLDRLLQQIGTIVLETWNDRSKLRHIWLLERLFQAQTFFRQISSSDKSFQAQTFFSDRFHFFRQISSSDRLLLNFQLIEMALYVGTCIGESSQQLMSMKLYGSIIKILRFNSRLYLQIMQQ